MKRESLNFYYGRWYDIVVTLTALGAGRMNYAVYEGYSTPNQARELLRYSWPMSNDCVTVASKYRYMALGALFGEARILDPSRLGALNQNGDEFAAPDAADAAYVFDADTMPWRRFPKGLTAEHPEVSLAMTLGTAHVTGLDQMKYVVVEPVLEGLPADATLAVSVNGAKVGTLHLNRPDGRVLGIRAGHLKANGQGKVVFTLTRTGDLSGMVAFDRILVVGGLTIGDGRGVWNEFGVPKDPLAQFTIGDTNVNHLSRGAMSNPDYPYLSLAFNLPEALTGVGFSFVGKVDRNITVDAATKTTRKTDCPMPFSIYANDTRIYQSATGLACGTSFTAAVPSACLRPGYNVIKIVNDATEAFMQAAYGVSLSTENYIGFAPYRFHYAPQPSSYGTFINIR